MALQLTNDNIGQPAIGLYKWSHFCSDYGYFRKMQSHNAIIAIYNLAIYMYQIHNLQEVCKELQIRTSPHVFLVLVLTTFLKILVLKCCNSLKCP